MEAAITWKQTQLKKPIKSSLPADDEVIIPGKWRGKDVKEFVHMWKCGLALKDIAKGWPDRTTNDLRFLHDYALKKGWISERPGGEDGRRRCGA
ncbi:hypothetical protein [Lihuaxuella thermophila]|uniref:Uncharacterized protein n=1 Tax=Lihuaxuella thermophila TaxID=1173111 RepID=A0A1H8HAV1_9BACL|nr:hypothetical protein [Lihuaxuella thermophila]SEN53343.1 hypothetical protein SAMN05444955_113122 [Lihuaxuella thermophila]SEN78234.1 hypothetical protein SAMN05444955_12337 [Lihuaxuella thermophila]SEN80320.1 hypothetical protein SAMN05444955_1265 [Lihuaxuella thermophila]